MKLPILKKHNEDKSKEMKSQRKENELVAKVKQFGPFHVFYTFSCGEMRWPEVFISALKRKGRKIVTPTNWNGNVAELEVIEDESEPIHL